MAIISGKVTDKDDKSGLPQANVWLSDNKGNKITPLIGVASDVDGNYTIDTTKNPNATHITASYIGYGKTIAPIPISSPSLDFPLGETDTLLKEFEVVYNKTAEEGIDRKKKIKRAIIAGAGSLAVILLVLFIIKTKKNK